MNLLIPDELARLVTALARAQGVSASEVVRTAVDEYVDRCRVERQAQRRRSRTRERDWETFDLLTG